MNNQKPSMKSLAFGALIAIQLGLVGTGQSLAADERVLPGVVAGVQVTEVVIVEAVDMATREVTLRRDDGELFTLVAGDDVRNLAQVEVGDRVVVQHTIGLVAVLSPSSGKKPERTDSVELERAELGQKPEGMLSHTVNVTGFVEAVDHDARVVTIKGAKRTVKLPVAEDIDLDAVKVGDQVDAVYQESLAISVQPAEAGK